MPLVSFPEGFLHLVPKAIKVKPRVALFPPPSLPNPLHPLPCLLSCTVSVALCRQEQSSVVDADAADHEGVLPPLQPAAR